MFIDSWEDLSFQDCLRILEGCDLDTQALVEAAYCQRTTHFGKQLSVHMINNAHNGHCSEDCRYCVQSRDSRARLKNEGAKSEETIVREAVRASRQGAGCYGIVFSGRALFQERLKKVSIVVRKIKEETALKVCVSAGFVDREQVIALKKSGVDRVHHNLNTSENFYPQICTTHSYTDRIRTVEACNAVGLPVCSGLIAGMGESSEDIVSTAMRLKELGVTCVPLNFYIPLEGSTLGERPRLSVDYCLRVLCLFRLINPRTELCLAAGRELYLRSVQPLVLQIVDGIFVNGYLNVLGDERDDVLEIAQQFGFSIDRGRDESFRL